MRKTNGDYIMDKRSYDRSESIDINGKMFHFTPDRKEFLATLTGTYPNQTSFTAEDLKNLGHVPYWVKSARYNFKDNGVFNLQAVVGGYTGSSVPMSTVKMTKPSQTNVGFNSPVAVATEAASMNIIEDNVKVIPEKMSNYVPFGHFKDVKSIIKSKIFFPIFITGLSGNGKTLMVEQVCAQLKRECYRVNVTIETDEDDLMGGHTLKGGDLMFREGPVLKAMRKGAVLLLDEVDLGSNKLMCLQSVLEGKGYLIKKTGEYVQPKEGFTIIGTANTKGQGSDDGKFIGTQLMNEAMLERFAITMQQEYPPLVTERKIVEKEMALNGHEVDKEFCEKLVDWASVIRKTFYEGAIDDVITTRRLVHIVNAWKMFGDRLKSIELCISRFDEETRDSFLDLYTKVDEGVNLSDEDYENPIDSDEV